MNDYLNELCNKAHESFKEYLLAEYYIESLLTNEPKPYRLNVGIPSDETMTFLDGLLKLIGIDDNKNKHSLIPYADRFLKSLSASQEKQIELTRAKSIIITNVRRSVEDENIVFYRENKREEKELWNTTAVHFTKYEELWMYRWISLFILSTFAPPNSSIDNKKLSLLIHATSNTTPFYLKRMSNLDLSSADLSSANLVGANLYHANLSRADLSGANLSGANLSGANLSRADLSGANLSGANLSRADLSNADLSGASLSLADLSGAYLSPAYFSSPNLSLADSFSDYLSHAKLPNDLKNALFPSASDGTTYEKNSSAAGQDVKQPFKRITYTSDGKPIINHEENEELL
jgi:hypothetical protein